MKTILYSVVALSFVLSPVMADEQKAEVKKVCVDKVTKDGKPVLDKEGKQVQDCKEMKVHKKLEGTKVEDAKKEPAKK